jgi:AraC-like DNA-binding protein
MSIYEKEAEKKGYFCFYKRNAVETPAHFHSAMELHFIESGEQSITIDGEQRLLKRGDACFCDSFSVHQLPPYNGESCYCLIADKAYFESAFALFDDKIPPRFFRFENFSALRLLYGLCKEKDCFSANGRVALEGIVKLLLSEIAESVPFQARKKDKQSTLVCRILQYAEEHVQDDLSLSAVARAMGYSQEHLSRVLHGYLSEHWSSYVNRLRVRRAETLLTAEPNRSILDIALSCGFDSPNTFYRAYKREFNRTPRKR